MMPSTVGDVYTALLSIYLDPNANMFIKDYCTVLYMPAAPQVLAVDVHPAARLGHGILLDHGTGVVIGETAVIGNNVSLLQV